MAGVAAYLIALEDITGGYASVSARLRQVGQSNVVGGTNGSKNVLLYNGSGL